MVKYLIGAYLAIGVLMAPFMRSNDLIAYRGFETSYSYGMTLASIPFWPSYFFSIEPELDGSSNEKFIQSIGKVLRYREEKMFTGKSNSKTYQNVEIVYNALGMCILAEGAKVNVDGRNMVRAFFEGNLDNPELRNIQRKVMKKFDDYDFADIYHAGKKCQKKYLARKKS